jgi:predicted acylesterase/phospholipase RssA
MPRNCDIVMKGGITSGIVYPAAVVEIAKDFVFKNVGGTSAGAIAAALTAAAERRRARDGSTAGFDRVGAIPDWLSQDSRLFKLFVPNASTKSLFRTFVGLLGRPRFQPAFVAKWLGLVWAYPLASALGAVAGVTFLVAVIRTYASTATWLWVYAIVAALFTIFAGITAAVGIALARDALRRLRGNAYGMVTGVDDADRTSELALCTWLAKELELTAGLEPGSAPLTFGMLWDAQHDPAGPGIADMPPQPDVNLEMITTNATWGRPYNFPVTTHQFFFDPDEMRSFFPDHVVAWMKQRSRAPRDAKEAAHFAAFAPRLALPVMGDLPVIVATRMSLAFPILLSAVPLWAADFTLAPRADGLFELERCWFTDGGISSNFPITLFDSPLPRWPTFAINLAPFPPGHPQQSDEANNVHMIARNADGRLPTFSRFTELPGFLSAIFNAMQNWNDNTQSMLPGYRDRVVTVYLSDQEGGLNLDMPADVLQRLKLRGAAAGALIAGRYKTPSLLPPVPGGMDWENHRWLRYRSAMGALKAHLASFARAARQPEAPDVTYDALVTATAGTPTVHYDLDPAVRSTVSALTDRIAATGDDLGALTALDKDLPVPVPPLAMRSTLKS